MPPGDDDRTQDMFRKYFQNRNLDPADAVFMERMRQLDRAAGGDEGEFDVHAQNMTLEEQARALRQLSREWAQYTLTRKSLGSQAAEEVKYLDEVNEKLDERIAKLETLRRQEVARSQGASGAAGHTIQRPNATQTQIHGGADRDYDPNRVDNRGKTFHETFEAVMSGDMDVKQLALQPIAAIQRRARGAEVTDPATGQMFRRPDALSRTIRYGGGGAAALYGASTALPFALQRVQGVYNQLAGSDISAGLEAGYSGSQGLAAGATGLVNRLAFLPQAMGLLPTFGSDAQRYGAERRIEAFRAGINPFDALSIGEAENIQHEILNRGYVSGSDQAHEVAQALYRLNNNTGIDAGQALDYFDTLTKRLGVSVSDVEKDLESFGKQAQAAGKSVDTYTKEVTALVEQQISMGTSADQAKAIAQTFASFRGIPGEALAGAVTTKNPMMMQEILRNNPQAMSTPSDMLSFLANPLGTLGASGGSEAIISTLDRALMIMKRYPGSENKSNAELIEQAKYVGLLPGMDAMDSEQLASIYEGREQFVTAGGRKEALTELSHGFKDLRQSGKMNRGNWATGIRPMSDVIADIPELKPLYDRYFSSIENDPSISEEDKAKIKDALYTQGKSPQEVESMVSGALKDKTGTANTATANVTLDATPELKRLIKVLDAKDSTRGSTLRAPGERNREGDNKDSTVWDFSRLGG